MFMIVKVSDILEQEGIQNAVGTPETWVPNR